MFPLSQNFDLRLIIRDFILDMSKPDWLMGLMPFTFRDTSKVVWEIKDNLGGLLPLRGLDGLPDILPLPGFSRYAVDPGYFGGTHIINEEMMQFLRDAGSYNDSANIEQLLGDCSESLATQLFNRARKMVADLVTTGQINIVSRDGAKRYNYRVPSYKILTAATAWSNTTSGKPIDDLMTIQNQLALGTTSDFGPESEIGMSLALANNMMKTDQVRVQIRGDYGSTEKGLDGLNRILKGYNLPAIKIYNESYFPTQASATDQSQALRFLPDDRLVWVGKRPGNQPFGEFQLVRNMVNQVATGGSPDQLEDTSGFGPDDLRRGIFHHIKTEQLPPQHRISAGFNGGGSIQYISSVAAVICS